MKQKTIQSTFTLNGIGIHSGEKISLTFKPSKSGSIQFIDPKHNSLTVSPKTSAKTHHRATQLESETLKILTPEHLLAACAALHITSLDIHISGDEVPIFDGSAQLIMTELQKAGIEELELPQIEPIFIQKTHTFWHNDSCIIVAPAPQAIFSYYLSYEHPVIGSQSASITLDEDSFFEEIAPARTFGFEKEVNSLLKQGLAQGGSLDNALVIGDSNYINTPRFHNECARHKLLDLIGDFWILNRPIKGHIIGIKSGHQLNNDVVKHLGT